MSAGESPRLPPGEARNVRTKDRKMRKMRVTLELTNEFTGATRLASRDEAGLWTFAVAGHWSEWVKDAQVWLEILAAKIGEPAETLCVAIFCPVGGDQWIYRNNAGSLEVYGYSSSPAAHPGTPEMRRRKTA